MAIYQLLDNRAAKVTKSNWVCRDCDLIMLDK